MTWEANPGGVASQAPLFSAPDTPSSYENFSLFINFSLCFYLYF